MLCLCAVANVSWSVIFAPPPPPTPAPYDQNMGTASFSGPGAGRYPTANSVVNDIVRLGTGKVGSPFPFDKVRPTRFCALLLMLVCVV